MTEVSIGARVTVGDGDPTALVIEATWDPGPVVADLVAFVCTASGTVVSQEHFVFFNNSVSADRAVFLLEDPAGGVNRGAQLMLDLTALPSDAGRVDLTLVASSQDGRRLPTLESVTDIRLALWDPADGQELTSFSLDDGGPCICLELGRLYRHQGKWKFWAIGNQYPKDFATLVRDYGVEVKR